MTFTVAQRQQAIGLYKRLLRTSRKTFDGDSAAVAAARDETRRRFQIAAQESDPTKIEEGLKMGEELSLCFARTSYRASGVKRGKHTVSTKPDPQPVKPFQGRSLLTLSKFRFVNRASHDQGDRTGHQ